ncbi:MAG: chemotaxis protein CheR, partial [Chromatiaceae bacterium]|nr:chemotaxis protein CheR [Chromatiaceae bacterium]
TVVVVIGFGDERDLLPLLQRLPAGRGVALVLIGREPLAPERLAEALAPGWTQATLDKSGAVWLPKADHLWLLPPQGRLVLVGGEIQLCTSTGATQAIDVTLGTLGEVFEEGAIAILLSGEGVQGAQGLRAIKAAGGMVMVQDPHSTEHDQMPRQALTAELADAVLAPEAMPDQLMRYLASVRRASTWGQRPSRGCEQDELGRVLALLRARTRHDFRGYRRRMLLRRVQRRMGLRHLDTVEDYLDVLRSDPDEPQQLLRDLLIGVTSFFRDPKAFEELVERVIAPLAERQSESGEGIRVWVPACSTGEEAYSMAMLLLEACEHRRLSCAIQVFATDIDHTALNIARHGLYPPSALAELDAQRLRRFFVESDEQGYRVSKQLREAVLFAPHNLLSDAPFSRLDLISCRNLLIYLEPEVQHKLIGLFHFALRPGGALLLGPSESIGPHHELFETLSKQWRLFRRLKGGRVPLPMLPASGLGDNALSAMPSHGSESEFPTPYTLAELAQRQLLNDYAPA